MCAQPCGSIRLTLGRAVTNCTISNGGGGGLSITSGRGVVVEIAVGETVILLTSTRIETPAKGREGCSRMKTANG